MYGQNLKTDLSIHNNNLDSLGNYNLEVNTVVYRQGKIIERENLKVTQKDNNYRLTTRFVNTYYSSKYQLVEDKMNKVYYLGLNDSSIYNKGLTGRLSDSFYSRVKSYQLVENDSQKRYTIHYMNDSISDSLKYVINKQTNMIEEMIMWIPDEEEYHVGDKELLNNNWVQMSIKYAYGKYSSSKRITDIVLFNKDNAELKNKNSDWELINMIPIQKQLIEQRKFKKLVKKKRP